MKDSLGLVPQVFYDLLGRVVPGAVFLALAVVLLPERLDVRAVAPRVLELHPATISIIFLMSGLAAYVTGFILGAIGAVCFEDRFKFPSFDRIKRTPPPVSESALTDNDLPYLYDFILIKDPPTGLRLAKLRAENHMCGALFICCITLAVLELLAGANSMAARLDGFIALFAIAGTALLFKLHLRTRTQRLEVNCWLILRDATPQFALAPEAVSPTAAMLSVRAESTDEQTPPIEQSRREAPKP